jgi:hypothetical protein
LRFGSLGIAILLSFFALVDFAVDSSVIVDNLYIVGFAILPAKTKAVLIVDAYAVLALAVSLQRLQPVSVGLSQIVKQASRVQYLQLSPDHSKNPAETAALSCEKELLGLPIGKRPYHLLTVSR